MPLFIDEFPEHDGTHLLSDEELKEYTDRIEELMKINLGMAELEKKLEVAVEALEKINTEETFRSPVGNMSQIIAKEALFKIRER